MHGHAGSLQNQSKKSNKCSANQQRVACDLPTHTYTHPKKWPYLQLLAICIPQDRTLKKGGEIQIDWNWGVDKSRAVSRLSAHSPLLWCATPPLDRLASWSGQQQTQLAEPRLRSLTAVSSWWERCSSHLIFSLLFCSRTHMHHLDRAEKKTELSGSQDKAPCVSVTHIWVTCCRNVQAWKKQLETDAGHPHLQGTFISIETKQ